MNQAQRIVETEYKEFGHVPSYGDVDKMLNDRNYYKDNPDFDNYHKLSAATSQQIIDIHNKEWKGYLVSIADYWRNLKKDKAGQKDYTGEPREPKYKKKDGEFILIFTNQQCEIRNEYLTFPKELIIYNPETKKWLRLPKIKVRYNDSYTKDGFDLYGDGDYDLYDKNKSSLSAKVQTLNQLKLISAENKGNLKKNIKLKEVRVIPQGVGYIVEIVYDKEVIDPKYNIEKI